MSIVDILESRDLGMFSRFYSIERSRISNSQYRVSSILFLKEKLRFFCFFPLKNSYFKAKMTFLEV